MWNGPCVTENSPSTVVVLDAGPLIHLDELGLLALLDIYGELLVPSDVWAETVKHRPALSLQQIPQAALLTDIPALGPKLTALVLERDLGRGEQAALAWLGLLRGGLLLSDDQDARRSAATLGFKVTGTVGVLIRAQLRGRMDRNALLDLIRSLRSKTSLHVSDEFISEVLASLAR
jgi:predicted nucleic acid-binding protein